MTARNGKTAGNGKTARNGKTAGNGKKRESETRERDKDGPIGSGGKSGDGKNESL